MKGRKACRLIPFLYSAPGEVLELAHTMVPRPRMLVNKRRRISASAGSATWNSSSTSMCASFAICAATAGSGSPGTFCRRACIRHITARAHDDTLLFNGIVDHSTSLFSKVFQDYCQMMEQQTKAQEQPNADDDDDADM